jgi:predicted phosphohydrolase
MRIVVTSDLHCGQSYNIERDIADARKLAKHSTGADLFVLAGDIGETAAKKGLETVEMTLKSFAQDLACKKAALGGNHDIAINQTMAEDSQELYLEKFDSLVRRLGFVNLENETIRLEADAGQVAVIGTIGPLTRHLPVRGPGDYSRAYHKFKTGTLASFESEILRAFAARLQAAEQDDSIEQIIVISHIPPALPKQPSSSFMNAIEKCAKVSLVVFGDTHKSFPAHRVGKVLLVPTLSDQERFASIVIDVEPFGIPSVLRWWIDQEEAIAI